MKSWVPSPLIQKLVVVIQSCHPNTWWGRGRRIMNSGSALASYKFMVSMDSMRACQPMNEFKSELAWWYTPVITDLGG